MDITEEIINTIASKIENLRIVDEYNYDWGKSNVLTNRGATLPRADIYDIGDVVDNPDVDGEDSRNTTMRNTYTLTLRINVTPQQIKPSSNGVMANLHVVARAASDIKRMIRKNLTLSEVPNTTWFKYLRYERVGDLEPNNGSIPSTIDIYTEVLYTIANDS